MNTEEESAEAQYRRLKVGEIVKEGDEYLGKHGLWYESQKIGENANVWTTYRRKIKKHPLA